MEKAIQDDTTGALGVIRADLEYQVPCSTLSNYITRRVCPGATLGPPNYLCEEEEEELVKCIAGCAEVGYAKNVGEIRAVVGAIVSNKLSLDNPIVVSHGWWDRFCQRHLHLILCAGEGIAFKRLAAINNGTIDHYYNILEETMKVDNLLNAPHLIFNANETGMPLCSCPGQRVAVKGSKHILVCNAGLKINVTVLACASAGGFVMPPFVMPPFVIYKRKNLVESLVQGEIPGTMYRVNPNSGWMVGWMVNYFKNGLCIIPLNMHQLPSLSCCYYVGEHASHYNPCFIRGAARR